MALNAASAALGFNFLTGWAKAGTNAQRKKQLWEWEQQTRIDKWHNQVKLHNKQIIGNDAKFWNAAVETKSKNIALATATAGKLNQLEAESQTAEKTAAYQNWQTYVEKLKAPTGLGTTGKRGGQFASGINTAAKAAAAATKTALELSTKQDLIASKQDALIDDMNIKTFDNAVALRGKLAITPPPPPKPAIPPKPDLGSMFMNDMFGVVASTYNLGFQVFAPGEGWRPSYMTDKGGIG